MPAVTRTTTLDLGKISRPMSRCPRPIPPDSSKPATRSRRTETSSGPHRRLEQVEHLLLVGERLHRRVALARSLDFLDRRVAVRGAPLREVVGLGLVVGELAVVRPERRRKAEL